MAGRRRIGALQSDRMLTALRVSVKERLFDRGPDENAGRRKSADDERMGEFGAPTRTLSRPRILFIGRSVAHLSYYESVITALAARGAEVEVLFDKGWSRNLPAGLGARFDEFRDERPDLKFGWLLRRGDKWRSFLFALRELRSYRNYLKRRETTPFYVKRWRSYLTDDLVRFADNRFVRALLKTGFTGSLLSAAEAFAPPDAGVRELLRQKNPNAVIVSPANMRFSEETDYLKAAKRLGVLTALPVLSWDNLSTKGLIQHAPDMVFVWNKSQYDDAVEIHKIPARRVVVAGAPFFDKWFDPPRFAPDRDAFCQRIGLDPARRIILYLGSSANIAQDETWFIEEAAEWLANAADPQLARAQILIRPHPANTKIYARLEEKGFLVSPRDGALPETQASFDDMRETFYHADAALSINTSAMVDAVLADLPVFSVKIDRYDATQSNSRHFRQLVDAGAICVSPNLYAFQRELATAFAGADQLAGKRRAFVESFARPCGRDRAAGDVIAAAILERIEERRHG